MSADNGIYILKTKAAEPVIESDFEYRVAHAQSIDGIYWDPERGGYREDGQFTPQIAFEYFGNAPMFRTQAEALSYAHKEAEGYDILEYGVCSLDHHTQLFETFTKAEMEEFENRSDALARARSHKMQKETEENLNRRTMTLPRHTYVEVFGRVEFPSPDWDGDKPETQKMLRGTFKGKVCVELLDDVEVVVDDEFAPVRSS